MRLLQNRRARMVVLASTLVALLVAFSASAANADHNKGTYGTHGYHFFARWNDFANVSVSSDYCNAREDGAYARIANSTKNASYMSDRWPSGVDMYTRFCDGHIDNTIEIKLNYLSNFESSHGNYGGENHSYASTSSFCAFYSAPYPCGYRYSIVHLNKSRFTSSSYSTAYRERLIMHETGHSLGLSHHCSSDAIMNDGTSGCNGGRWTSVMSYQSTDRKGIRETYPGWRYP